MPATINVTIKTVAHPDQDHYWDVFAKLALEDLYRLQREMADKQIEVQPIGQA